MSKQRNTAPVPSRRQGAIYCGGIAALGITGGLGLDLGIGNLHAAVTLEDQVDGFAYSVTGAIASVGAIALMLWLLHRTNRVSAKFPAALVATGFAAGLYITVSLAFATAAYSQTKMWICVALGVICGCGIGLLSINGRLNKFWKKSKVVSVALGLLVTGAQLWYQSIYLPENTDVGMQISVALDPHLTAAGSLRLAHLHLSIEDTSSDSATALTSMVTIMGVSYVPSQRNANLSTAATQSNAVEAGIEGGPLDVHFNGSERRTVLAVTRVINDGATFFSDNVVSRDIVVAIPAGDYQELDVAVRLDYARTTRLALGKPYYGPRRVYDHSCANDVRTAWLIKQSPVRAFTRGNETVVTNWCATLKDQEIFSYIGGAPGAETSGAAETRNASVYGLASTSRFDMFPL